MPSEHYAEGGKGRHKVWADLVWAGEELILYIGGGERAHIGSFTLASPGGSPISGSIPSHKDFLVSSEAAKRLSDSTGRTCLVVAGIHVDNASPEDILLLTGNARAVTGRVLRKLAKKTGVEK